MSRIFKNAKMSTNSGQKPFSKFTHPQQFKNIKRIESDDYWVDDRPLSFDENSIIQISNKFLQQNDQQLQKCSKSVGLLYCYFPQKNRQSYDKKSKRSGNFYMNGTAFFIGKNLLLTAAHNIYYRQYDQQAAQIYFHQQNSITKQKKLIPAKKWKVFPQFKHPATLSYSQRYDLALILLQSETQSGQENWLQIQWNYKMWQHDTHNVTMMGYPQKSKQNQDFKLNIQTKECYSQDQFIHYNHQGQEGYKGYSGCPIIIDKRQTQQLKHKVIGWHKGQRVYYKYGLTFNDFALQMILQIAEDLQIQSNIPFYKPSYRNFCKQYEKNNKLIPSQSNNFDKKQKMSIQNLFQQQCQHKIIDQLKKEINQLKKLLELKQNEIKNQFLVVNNQKYQDQLKQWTNKINKLKNQQKMIYYSEIPNIFNTLQKQQSENKNQQKIPMSKYIQKLVKQQKITFNTKKYYGKFSQQLADRKNFYFNFAFSTSSEYFNHQNIAFEPEQFFNYDCSKIQDLNLIDSSMNQIKWKKLIQNAHLLNKVKILYINFDKNRVPVIKRQDLQKFESLIQIKAQINYEHLQYLKQIEIFQFKRNRFTLCHISEILYQTLENSEWSIKMITNSANNKIQLKLPLKRVCPNLQCLMLLQNKHSSKNIICPKCSYISCWICLDTRKSGYKLPCGNVYTNNCIKIAGVQKDIKYK